MSGGLRVVLHAVPLSSAGGRTVGLNVIRSLRQAAPQHEYLALVPEGVGYEEACVATGLAYRTFRRGRGYAAWRIWFDQVGVQRIADEFGADVLYTMGNLGPIRPRRPHVILFHNPYYIYDWDGVVARLSPWERFLFAGQRTLFGQSLARAATVIAQTPVARERLAARFGVPPERLAVVPNAVSLDHLQAGADSPQAARMRAAGGTGRLRVLTLSRYYPHKNLEQVLAVAEWLRARGEHGITLFLTIGADQHPGAARLLAEIARRGLGEQVVNLGPVPLATLPSIYAATDVVFLPTLLESFSGSYLEAMHYQRPIVTSRLDFAEECCGEAALYADPAEPAASADALLRLAGDAALRAELGRRGAARLAQYGVGWPEVTRAMVAVLERAAGGPR